MQIAFVLPRGHDYLHDDYIYDYARDLEYGDHHRGQESEGMDSAGGGNLWYRPYMDQVRQVFDAMCRNS